MAKSPFESNTLFYGDNLEVLRKHFPDECIDLIYLDPPFNSKADYNILFKESTGEESAAQIQAFSDSWHWDKAAEQTYLEIQADPNLLDMIQFLHAYLGKNDMMAYLVMMTIRLRELHRVLKSTGSLFLHCDYHASAFLRILLSKIFGESNFRNEIIWQRTSSHNDPKNFGNITDHILYFVKSTTFTWNRQYIPFSKGYTEKWYRNVDDKGRRYMSSDLASPHPRPNLTYEYKGFRPPANGWKVSLEVMKKIDAEGRLIFPKDKNGIIRRKVYLEASKGQPLQNLWTDIPPIHSQAKERLGYPTQKPTALLKRIINATTDEGDVVLDPFCGCGTTIMASQELKRTWLGIDVTHLAISLIRSRLKDIHVLANKDYKIIGEPADVASAVDLMKVDRTGYQFQWWALSLIDAKPAGQSETSPQGKKGADKGVDGWLTFKESDNLDLQRIVVQVKGGHVGAQDVRDLFGTVQSKKVAMGILITLHEPTEPMKQAAFEAEYYESKTWGHKYPKIQILTIPELLKGSKPILPHTH